MMFYILNEAEEPVPVSDTLTWARWFETAERHVANDIIGDVQVSTVFLGSDHNWSGVGPPILWETMIFGGEHDEYQDRYSSREDALDGHAKALKLVRGEA